VEKTEKTEKKGDPPPAEEDDAEFRKTRKKTDKPEKKGDPPPEEDDAEFSNDASVVHKKAQLVNLRIYLNKQV
jgi:hypothetical protein